MTGVFDAGLRQHVGAGAEGTAEGRWQRWQGSAVLLKLTFPLSPAHEQTDSWEEGWGGRGAGSREERQSQPSNLGAGAAPTATRGASAAGAAGWEDDLDLDVDGFVQSVRNVRVSDPPVRAAPAAPPSSSSSGLLGEGLAQLNIASAQQTGECLVGKADMLLWARTGSPPPVEPAKPVAAAPVAKKQPEDFFAEFGI
jgi:hypothetical protein